MRAKVTVLLKDQVRRVAKDDEIEVVVELKPRRRLGPLGAGSRKERLATMKQAFVSRATPVEQAIQGLGGTVTGSLWLDQTVRATVPASKVDAVSRLDGVAAVDVPRALTAE